MLRPYTTRIRIRTEHQIRVPRHRFPEDAALPVAGARRLRARRGLEIVDEALHHTTLHETRGTRRHALVVERTRRRPARRQRVVAEGKALVEHRLAHLAAERRDTLEDRLTRQPL